jgi:hypothetical protein
MLHTLAKNPSLKEIRLILPPPRIGQTDYKMHYQDLEPRVKDLVVFLSEFSSVGSPNIAPSDPLFVPMAHVDNNVRDAIWDRILHFALEVDACRDGTKSFNNQLMAQLTDTRTSVPQVSKLFKVIQIHYHHFHIRA